MTVCPSCNKEGCTKDGIVNGKQRYKCKSCDYRHTVKYLGISPEIKR
ncbi:MAG: IS1 family transposase [Methylococcales bacterium]|nr:IS1 family transposase [Methylococcales bacterium]